MVLLVQHIQFIQHNLRPMPIRLSKIQESHILSSQMDLISGKNTSMLTIFFFQERMVLERHSNSKNEINNTLCSMGE